MEHNKVTCRGCVYCVPPYVNHTCCRLVSSLHCISGTGKIASGQGHRQTLSLIFLQVHSSIDLFKPFSVAIPSMLRSRVRRLVHLSSRYLKEEDRKKESETLNVAWPHLGIFLQTQNVTFGPEKTDKEWERGVDCDSFSLPPAASLLGSWAWLYKGEPSLRSRCHSWVRWVRLEETSSNSWKSAPDSLLGL